MVTISLAQDTNGVGATSVDVKTVTSATIDAAADLTATGIAGFKADASLTVKGAASSVSIGTMQTELDTIDASGMTAGGVTVTLDAEKDTKFIGGDGSDIVTTGGVSYAEADKASINAGDGTDRLVVANSTDLDAAAEGAKFTNFEVLQVQNGVNVDLDFISGITGVRLNDAAGNTGFTDLSAAQAANITIVAADNNDTDTDGSGSDTDDDGELSIGVKGAGTVGQIDTVKLTIDDGAAATSTANLGTPTMANVENLEINAVDNVTVTALTGAPQLTSITLTGAGTQNIDTGAVDFALNTKIDGSTATGVLTIDLTGADAGDTSGVAILGGSKGDTLTGGGQADVITGGAGDDTISGGAGADTYVFAGTAADNGSDTLTIVAASDILDFKAFLSGGSVDQNGGAGAAIVAYTSASTADVNITNKVALYSTATETDVDAAAEIAALVDDANDAFSITAGGKAIIVTGDAGGAADVAKIWYVNDANGDGDVADANEVGLVGTTGAGFDLDTLTTADFAFS